MKEKPILFSGPMVKAILEGRKTQTRRVINPQPTFVAKCDTTRAEFWAQTGPINHRIKCPYGRPSDHLWVRETWRLWSNATDWYVVSYPASGSQTYPVKCYRDLDVLKSLGSKPARFMPREFSRITLEVTGVRVERVQEITSSDALAEGIDKEYAESTANWNDYGTGSIYVDQFAALWDTINAKRGYSWKANPWVWIIEFEVAK